MNKLLLSIALAMIGAPALAQWAVYDRQVHDELVLINRIARIDGNTQLDQSFQNRRSGERGDYTLGTGDNQAILRSLETPFHEMEISDEDKARFIGTEQDCGDARLNPQHHNACLGLRNLRLQTLMQSQQLLRNLEARRTQVVNLITASRSIANEAGQLQRYQFELQAQQALLQADGLQLKILMEGYRQREKTYEMQMAEARRVSDSRQPGSISMGAVPFVPGLLP